MCDLLSDLVAYRASALKEETVSPRLTSQEFLVRRACCPRAGSAREERPASDTGHEDSSAAVAAWGLRLSSGLRVVGIAPDTHWRSHSSVDVR